MKKIISLVPYRFLYLLLLSAVALPMCCNMRVRCLSLPCLFLPCDFPPFDFPPIHTPPFHRAWQFSAGFSPFQTLQKFPGEPRIPPVWPAEARRRSLFSLLFLTSFLLLLFGLLFVGKLRNIQGFVAEMERGTSRK